MKIDFLRTLSAVLRHGSFAAAAPHVNLTASGVGLQIKQLEAYFGRPLLDRSGRQFRPTALALDIVAIVEAPLDALDSLRSKVEISVSGTLRLGVIESAQTALLPAMMRELRGFAPKLDVRFTRGVSRFLLQQVLAGQLDAAIVVRPEQGGSGQFQWTPLRKETFVLIAPAGTRGRDPLELLRTHDWIRFDRSITGGAIAAAYVEKVLPGKRAVMDLPGSEAIIAMVAAGVGVSVIPESRPELRLGPAAPIREVALACRRADSDNRRIQAIARALKQSLQTRARGSGLSPREYSDP